MAAVVKLAFADAQLRNVTIDATRWDYLVDCTGQAASVKGSRLRGSAATTRAAVRLGSSETHCIGNYFSDVEHAVEFSSNTQASIGNFISNMGKAMYLVTAGASQNNRALDVGWEDTLPTFTHEGGILPRVGLDAALNVDIAESGKGHKDVVYWDSDAGRYKLAQLNDLTGTTLLDTQTLQSVLFTSGNTFPAGELKPLTLTGVLFSSGNTFTAGNVGGPLAGVLFTSSNTFPTGRITGTIEGVLFTSGNTFPTGLIFN